MIHIVIKDIIDKTKEQRFICIGTSKNSYDSVGPKIGSILKDKGYMVYGVVGNEIHGMNLNKKLKDVYISMPKDKSNIQLIAIDAAFLFGNNSYKIVNYISPGNGVNKKLPKIKCKSIMINVIPGDYSSDIKRSLLLSVHVTTEIEVEMKKLAMCIAKEIDEAIK